MYQSTTITFHADGNQNLDLNLGIAPPDTSDGLKVNSNMGGFYFQSGWDGLSIDRAPKVTVKSMLVFLRPK
jgi:AP2-like factor (euAP2 lineage)